MKTNSQSLISFALKQRNNHGTFLYYRQELQVCLPKQFIKQHFVLNIHYFGKDDHQDGRRLMQNS